MIQSTKVKVYSESIKIKDFPWCIMYALLINLINRTSNGTNTMIFTTTNMAYCDWNITFTWIHRSQRFNHAPITTSHFNSCENVMLLNLLKYDNPHINIKWIEWDRFGGPKPKETFLTANVKKTSEIYVGGQCLGYTALV